ncbi:MAG TPA: molybdopterin cofactor-binding domain-containing protein, partial [Planctomycetota bacterium]|nr:molybdopterin cofactor-binding domain-containing protein [Planctomycetota bacterium]
RVDCKPLPWAVDAEQALAPDAPKVAKNGNLGKDTTEGDEAKAMAAFAAGDARVEAEYRVPVQHHASLETHGVVVDYRGGEDATVYCSTQGTFIVPEAAAEPLGLKQDKVTSVVEYMGGGFGSKFDFGIEGKTACELARELKRPVHLMLTREQEFLVAGNRSGSIVKVRAAAARDGTLTAMVSDVHRMGGIGPGSFDKLPYIYRVQEKEGVRSAVRSLLTHTDSSRAMRAPGRPQTSFPMESVIDELAFKLGIDPLTMRKKNLENTVWHRQLDRAAERIGWAKHPNKIAPQEKPDADGTKTGIGFGICVWGGGGRKTCEVKVSIRQDGSVQAAVGTQDLGTGTRTYVAGITAEEFGLPLDAVTARIGNSNLGNANPSGGSQTTASLAPAVKDAAYNAAQAFLEHLAGVTKRSVEELAFRGGSLVEATGPKALMTWKEACATLGTSGLSADGEWRKELADNGVHGAQAAKVKVDLATGRVQVLQMVGVQDCGLPLNRKAVESQLNGGMIQALSFALHEERVIDPVLGLMLNANFNDYKIAGCQEMPELVPLIDEDDIGRNPIGMAEPAIIPGHSAIANAIFNACGVRLHSLPFTADKILDGLAAIAAKEGGK